MPSLLIVCWALLLVPVSRWHLYTCSMYYDHVRTCLVSETRSNLLHHLLRSRSSQLDLQTPVGLWNLYHDLCQMSGRLEWELSWLCLCPFHHQSKINTISFIDDQIKMVYILFFIILDPRKLFDTTKEDDALLNMSHDHDEDKYKRRPALQWFARWFK